MCSRSGQDVAETGIGSPFSITLGGLLAVIQLLVCQILDIPAVRAHAFGMFPESGEAGAQLIQRHAALAQRAVDHLLQQLAGLLGISGSHALAELLVDFLPGSGILRLVAGEERGILTPQRVVQRLCGGGQHKATQRFVCLAAFLIGMSHDTEGIGKALGFSSLGIIQICGQMQSAEGPVGIPRNPVQATLPGKGIGWSPAAIHIHNVGTVPRLTSCESRHAIGAGSGCTEVGQTATHTTHILSEGKVIIIIHSIEGCSIPAGLHRIAKHVIGNIPTAPATVGVLVCRQVHMTQSPLEGLHGAG